MLLRILSSCYPAQVTKYHLELLSPLPLGEMGRSLSTVGSPSISSGSASVNSTNHRATIFRKKCYVVADVGYGVRPTMAVSVLSMYKLFSCLYSLNNTA